jgi:hypothetical protein
MKSGLLVGGAILVALSIASSAQAPPRLVPQGPERVITYYIADGIPKFGSRAGDNELATWAFDEWERAAGGAFRFEAIPEEGFALVRFYWNGSGREYGKMRPHIGTFSKRQAIVAIRPDAHSRHKTLGPAAAKDQLLRDTIVYLTSLHEIGHGLGLGHTTVETDVMRADASAENFQRYRRRLKTRADISKVPWLSDADTARIRQLYQR